jgi:hypothetical protein
MKISEIDQPLSISLIRLEWQRIEQKKVIKKMTEIIELIYIV